MIVDLIKKIFQYRAIRYLFCGGFTTAVNFVSYAIFRYVFNIDVTTAGFLSTILAIIVAYIGNKIFVFQSKTDNFKELIKEASQFIGMRFSTLFIEVFGVVLLSAVWGLNDLIAKFLIQFVVLALNYVISKFFVFQDKTESAVELTEEEKKLKKFRNICFLISFITPMVALVIGFACNKVFPFGDRAILIIDSAHQYMPFYTEFFRKLKSGESLLYTFGGGLGTNFWALYAYYLSSPLSFLILLFTENHIMEGMACLIILKVGLSGGIFSYYLNTRLRKTNLMIVPFSVLFALSNFMLGYYFNIMWLDCIMLLPLVMLGIEKLVKGQGGRYYGGMLGIVLFCNYYIGFMICLFACCYFLIQSILKKRQTIKSFFIDSINFAKYSILAGGMSAIVLLPAYKALEITKSVASNSGFPEEIETFTDWLTMITQHFVFVEPITISDYRDDLNVYCGIIALIFGILYLLDNYISKKERIVKGTMCLILFGSFNINFLNYIWHGFHYQNGLPNRFAFLYIALLLTMAFDVSQHIPRLSLKRILVACILPVIVVAYTMMYWYGEHEIYVYGITLLLLNIYMWATALYKLRFFRKKIYYILLTAFILIEAVANGVFGVISNGTISRDSYLNSKNSYQEMIADHEEEENFYRSEMDQTIIRNEIMYQGGRGAVIFSSTVPVTVIDLQKALGMEARTNKSGYSGVTRLVNDIFGIKYLASRTSTEELYQFPQVDKTDTLTLYKNENALSLGFVVDRTIKQWDIEKDDHMAVQNDFISKATGLDYLYTTRETYTTEEDLDLNLTMAPNEKLYLDLDREVESIKITNPGYTKTYSKYTEHLYDLGCFEEGGEVSIEIKVKENSSKAVNISIYSYQDEDYQNLIQRLSRDQLEIETFEADHIKGSIQVTQAGTFMMSLPDDGGWTLKVNGQKTDYFNVGDALMAIDLDEGTYDIELKYTPPGLWLGSAVSIICLLLYFILKDKKYVPEVNEEDPDAILPEEPTFLDDGMDDIPEKSQEGADEEGIGGDEEMESLLEAQGEGMNSESIVQSEQDLNQELNRDLNQDSNEDSNRDPEQDSDQADMLRAEPGESSLNESSQESSAAESTQEGSSTKAPITNSDLQNISSGIEEQLKKINMEIEEQITSYASEDDITETNNNNIEEE